MVANKLRWQSHFICDASSHHYDVFPSMHLWQRSSFFSPDLISSDAIRVNWLPKHRWFENKQVFFGIDCLSIRWRASIVDDALTETTGIVGISHHPIITIMQSMLTVFNTKILMKYISLSVCKTCYIIFVTFLTICVWLCVVSWPIFLSLIKGISIFHFIIFIILKPDLWIF